MTVVTKTIRLSTQGNADIQDITVEVAAAVQQTGLRNGIVIVFTPSATSALTTIEYESGCVQDLQHVFDEIADPNQTYQHELKWHDGNGHSHVRAALLGPSLTIPFVNHQLTLGTWQQIVFIDFDTCPRRRELVVQVIGE